MDPGAYTPAIGTNARTEQVEAVGFAVVVDGRGNGRVVGTLKNTENQPHALTGAAIKSDGTPVRTALLADVIRLAPRRSVALSDAPPISVPAANLSVGGFVELTWTSPTLSWCTCSYRWKPRRVRTPTSTCRPVPDERSATMLANRQRTL